MPLPDLLRFRLLLVAMWTVPLHMGTSTFKATFLLSGRSLLYFLQYSLQQHRLLHYCLCHRFQADLQG